MENDIRELEKKWKLLKDQDPERESREFTDLSQKKQTEKDGDKKKVKGEVNPSSLESEG
ncbi:MAG: hypothetical protein WCE57_01875 [Salegentibacter sp.]